MENRLSRKNIGTVALLAAWAGALLFFAGVLGFGAMLEGYSQVLHPVSLLGATGVPRAQAFNLLAFVLPGLLAALVAMELRARLPVQAGWAARLGTQLLLLSALGLAAMGLLPLDPQDLESEESRMHGTAWMGWIIAFVLGTAALAVGLARKRLARRFAAISGAASIGVVLAGFVLPDLLGAGAAQRLAFLVWFGWFVYAARRSSLATHS